MYSEAVTELLPIRYRDFYWGLISSFQCITLDGWDEAMMYTWQVINRQYDAM